jgi:hypothetical protein
MGMEFQNQMDAKGERTTASHFLNIPGFRDLLKKYWILKVEMEYSQNQRRN